MNAPTTNENVSLIENLNITPSNLEQLIQAEIFKLNPNTKNERKKLYNYYIDEYKNQIPIVYDIVIEVESQFEPIGRTRIVAAIFLISLFTNVVEYLIKPVKDYFNIGAVYIACGLLLALICKIQLKRKLNFNHRIELKYGVIVGIVGFLIGLISISLSHLKVIPENSSVVYAGNIVNLPILKYAKDSSTSGISSDANNQEALKSQNISNKLLSFPGFFRYQPYFENPLSNYAAIAVDEEESQYCTIYINSQIIDENSRKIAYSSISLSKKYQVLQLGLLSISFDENTVRIIPDGQKYEIKGNYGTLKINYFGQYEYVLDNALGFGKFEKFVAHFGKSGEEKTRRHIFVSIIGPDLRGTEVRDTVFAYPVPNRMSGNEGDDRLHGNIKDDVIYGGDGDDLILGYAGNDVLIGGNGKDTISGGIGDDSIDGGDEDDFITGDDGDDGRLFGGKGDDVIYGGLGDDIINGEEGNDNLIGGQGGNILYGGSGADTFWFVIEKSQIDIIRDFDLQEGDRLDITNIVDGNLAIEKLKSVISAKPSSRGLILLIQPLNKSQAVPFVLLENFKGNLDDMLNSNALIYNSKSSN